MYTHWIDTATGDHKPGWDSEYATMSTMQLCKGAILTRGYYAGNAGVEAAAGRILGGVRNWDDYFAPSGALRLCASARGGAVIFPTARPFNEGMLFAELAAAYGHGQANFDRWLDRSLWPVVEDVPGFPVTSNLLGEHLPAFVSIYPDLLIHRFRDDSAWHTHMRNLQVAGAAWCDDHAPRWYTVFSAGTTRRSWARSGYNADSLSGHPGDISTFPALLGLCSSGGNALSVAAYHAYRLGARERFAGGAEMLYRRSNEDPSYLPDSAGLPDVAMGGLGLAELARPGVLDRILAAPL